MGKGKAAKQQACITYTAFFFSFTVLCCCFEGRCTEGCAYAHACGRWQAVQAWEAAVGRGNRTAQHNGLGRRKRHATHRQAWQAGLRCQTGDREGDREERRAPEGTQQDRQGKVEEVQGEGRWQGKGREGGRQQACGVQGTSPCPSSFPVPGTGRSFHPVPLPPSSTHIGWYRTE